MSHLGWVPRVPEKNYVSGIQTDRAMRGRAIKYVLYQVYHRSVHVMAFLSKPGKHFSGVRWLKIIHDHQGMRFRLEIIRRSTLDEYDGTRSQIFDPLVSLLHVGVEQQYDPRGLVHSFVGFGYDTMYQSRLSGATTTRHKHSKGPM